MLDHVGITVSDYETSKQFYIKAFEAIGYKLLMEVQGCAGFGIDSDQGPLATFWIHQGEPATDMMHIAFRTDDRSKVDAFYDAAMAAGGKDHGKPGVREIYHPNYYGAFVLDPDGYNVEAVCHKPE
ncbi:MAG: glyoxalase/bleomycin resistance/extradiol dioxygenase family protein [Coxiella sp. (in: Bacteria)]|nr:MAG: glyoxalase/bleomycin resistance/extradiol dioxygenase family protein [Coxiella sp. (in: g-proteobacteria)]